METVVFNKEDLRTLLSEGTVDIAFEKVNGDTREMSATLSADIIPQVEPDEGVEKSPKAKNDSSLAVWDVSISQWRSFRWDKLKTVNGMKVKLEV